LSASGYTIGQVCRTLGITKQTFYRWRSEFAGMQVSQAKRLLERENTRLRKAIAELTLDKLILQEATKQNV
jgi:transposase-like protein